MATALQLAFADHVHEFDSGKRNGGRQKRFESPHRPGHSFDRPVILLDNIIEILDLWPEASHSPFDARFLFNVVAFYRYGIGATLVEGDFLRHATLVDGLASKARRGFALALGSQEDVNRSACFVERSIQVFPLTFEADIRLVQGLTYGGACWPRACASSCLPNACVAQTPYRGQACM